jgi:hypothetical protein
VSKEMIVQIEEDSRMESVQLVGGQVNLIKTRILTMEVKKEFLLKKSRKIC